MNKPESMPTGAMDKGLQSMRFGRGDTGDFLKFPKNYTLEMRREVSDYIGRLVMEIAEALPDRLAESMTDAEYSAWEIATAKAIHKRIIYVQGGGE